MSDFSNRWPGLHLGYFFPPCLSFTHAGYLPLIAVNGLWPFMEKEVPAGLFRCQSCTTRAALPCHLIL